MLRIYKNKSIKTNTQEEDMDMAEFPIELLSLMQQPKESFELEDRGIIFINSVLTKQTLDRPSKKLLNLHFNSEFTDPIQILINSPGGFTDAGWAFIDIMESIKNPITTIAIGEIASMATSIFIAGDKRIMSPNSIAMIHEFSTGTSGNYSDLVASRKAEDIEYQKDLDHLLRHSKYTSHTQITNFLLKDTDNWLTPKEMRIHGLCDEISLRRKRKLRTKIKPKTKKK